MISCPNCGYVFKLPEEYFNHNFDENNILDFFFDITFCPNCWVRNNIDNLTQESLGDVD